MDTVRKSVRSCRSYWRKSLQVTASHCQGGEGGGGSRLNFGVVGSLELQPKKSS